MIKSNQYDVKVELSELRSIGYTTLDTLHGKIILNLRSELSINCIQMKFKGINRTTLKEKVKDKIITKHEEHILIDDIQTVFPKREIESLNYDDTRKVFSLKPGEYQYDFQFKIPLNSICINTKSASKSKFKLNSTKSSSSLSLTDQSISSSLIAHTQSILPPTYKDPNTQIEYYLKVVIIRPSLLKANIKRIQQVPITPFNGVEYLHKSKMLNFVRKEVIFKDKLPEIIGIIEPIPYSLPKQSVPTPTTPKQSSQSSFTTFKSFIWGTGSPAASPTRETPPPLPAKNPEPTIIDSFDVPFYFEVRSFGFIQVIGKPLQLKLLLLSKVSSKRYLGLDGKSSGLGSIYLQKLNIELVILTKIKAQDLIKESKQVLSICDLQIGGYKLDLCKSSKSKAINEQTGNALYEIEIPPELYSGVIIPDNHSLRTLYDNKEAIYTVPSFKTCNIERSYKLNISASFTETRTSKNSKLVELDVPISVLSGISPPVGFETLPPPTRKLPSYEEVIRN